MVAVGVTVDVDVDVGVTVAVGVSDAVGVTVGVGVIVGVGVGETLQPNVKFASQVPQRPLFPLPLAATFAYSCATQNDWSTGSITVAE